MKTLTRAVLITVGALACVPVSAAESDGSLPIYPHARSSTDVPGAAIAQGVPMLTETDDTVITVENWYRANAPKGCARTAASSGVKYQCPGGSIVIFTHGKTQIAFVPTMPHF